MHEFGVASEVLRVARETAASHGASALVRVKVAVGELSAVEPDLLRFAWDALVAEEGQPGAALEVEWHAARTWCDACAAERPSAGGRWLVACATCGAPLRVDGGRELDVVEVEFEAPEAGAAEERGGS